MKTKIFVKSFKLRTVACLFLLIFFWMIVFSHRVFASSLWTQRDDGMNGEWRALRSSASGNELVGLFYNYDDGLLYVEYSGNGGTSWRDATPNDPSVDDVDEFNSASVDRHVWSAVDISADGNNIILSDNNGSNSHNYVWYSPNSGYSWQKMDAIGQPGAGYWTSVSIAENGKDFTAADGSSGENLYVSTDYGDTWLDVAPFVSDWEGVSFSPDGGTLAAYDSGGYISVSSNQGTSWTDTPSPHNTWADIVAANDGELVVGGIGIDAPVYVWKFNGISFSWVNTDLVSLNNVYVDISADGQRIGAVDGLGYIYFANISDPTIWNGQSDPGDPGNDRWYGIAMNSDGTRVSAAGYYTEMWTYENPGDFTPPTVESVSPADGSKAKNNTKIAITFSETMETDNGIGLDTSPCDVGEAMDCAQYNDPVWSEGDTVATFTRIDGESFKAGTNYDMQVYAEDANHNVMAEPYEWTFTAKKVATTSGGSVAGFASKSGNQSLGNNNPTPPPTNQTPSEPIVPIITVTNSDIDKVVKDLKFGMTDADVKILQDFLIAKAKGPAALVLKTKGSTGFFGKLTQSALAEWQAANGVTPSAGYFGPKTRAKIKELGL